MADSFFCVFCDDCGASTQLRLAPAGRLRPGGGFSIKGDRSSLASSASTGSGGLAAAPATSRITSFANLSVSIRSWRSCCSFNDLRHVAGTTATPVTPVTPVFGGAPPRKNEARRSRSSCRIVAPVENAGRQDINALVCPVDFSHRLKAIARPQQHSRGEGRVGERVLHGALRSWVQARLPGNIDRLGSTLQVSMSAVLSPSFTLP
jgi:hypothetical protein